MRKEKNNRNIWIKMIEAVCTGRLIILKKYDLSVLNLYDLFRILFLLQRIANSAVDSAYARAGMQFANGMLQCRMNLSRKFSE